VKLDAALVVCAVGAALAPTSSAAIERWYSNAWFPRLQPILTSISNRSGIAFLDVMILAAILAVAAIVVGRVRSRRTSARSAALAVVRSVPRALGFAAALYLVFLLAWGLNYRRVPLIQRVRFDPERLSIDRARGLAEQSTARLNALYQEAHRDTRPAPYAPDERLAAAFYAASSQFGVSFRPVLPRPKRSLLDAYFRRAGVAGMTDPFFLEALIASDLLPIERPFVIAHEWSHVAGIADEGEANFAGWLTCLRGAPAHQYSGWLFAYSELTGALGGRDRRQVAALLGTGPRDDLLAIRERLQRHVEPRVSAAGWRVYDSYLKANRVAAGSASYSQVVRLMLGVVVEM
jgi:hypothetical protein